MRGYLYEFHDVNIMRKNHHTRAYINKDMDPQTSIAAKYSRWESINKKKLFSMVLIVNTCTCICQYQYAA